MLKVLHINQSDASGGAAIAASRLHQGLLSQGVVSSFLVGKAEQNYGEVHEISRNRKIEKLISRISTPLGHNMLHCISSFAIPCHPAYQQADILNFHNLHPGYFNYLAVPKLTASTPAVYTLHDMWSFTGHCAYSYDCERWKTGCGQCPYPQVYPRIKRDSTALEWKLKNWTYDRADLTIITPSRWLTTQAKQSMLSRFSIHHIPNGIDTEAYQPVDPEQCRAILGLPAKKFVLMFGADKLGDSRKGGDLLLKALELLPDSLKAEIILLTFGSGGEAMAAAAGMAVMDLGYVSNDRFKAIAYSAADIFVFPTRADNLPLVLQESMACGTPMVSFNIGGVPDLVRPGVTGYLAQPENSEDLCQRLIQLLEDQSLRQQMARNCRAIALQEYPIELQAKRYIDLYKNLL
jgi:glycosyltransferase involved in cell wall biosynthesis